MHKKRLLATPGSEKMLSKLGRFVEKWKDMQDLDRRGVFTSETLVAIE